jgi:hypothetical protein
MIPNCFVGDDLLLPLDDTQPIHLPLKVSVWSPTETAPVRGLALLARYLQQQYSATEIVILVGDPAQLPVGWLDWLTTATAVNCTAVLPPSNGSAITVVAGALVISWVSLTERQLKGLASAAAAIGLIQRPEQVTAISASVPIYCLPFSDYLVVPPSASVAGWTRPMAPRLQLHHYRRSQTEYDAWAWDYLTHDLEPDQRQQLRDLTPSVIPLDYQAALIEATAEAARRGDLGSVRAYLERSDFETRDGLYRHSMKSFYFGVYWWNDSAYLMRCAVIGGLKMVELLLADNRINPAAMSGIALRDAELAGHQDIAERLQRLWIFKSGRLGLPKEISLCQLFPNGPTPTVTFSASLIPTATAKAALLHPVFQQYWALPGDELTRLIGPWERYFPWSQNGDGDQGFSPRVLYAVFLAYLETNDGVLLDSCMAELNWSLRRQLRQALAQ